MVESSVSQGLGFRLCLALFRGPGLGSVRVLQGVLATPGRFSGFDGARRGAPIAKRPAGVWGWGGFPPRLASWVLALLRSASRNGGRGRGGKRVLGTASGPASGWGSEPRLWGPAAIVLVAPVTPWRPRVSPSRVGFPGSARWGCCRADGGVPLAWRPSLVSRGSLTWPGFGTAPTGCVTRPTRVSWGTMELWWRLSGCSVPASLVPRPYIVVSLSYRRKRRSQDRRS